MVDGDLWRSDLIVWTFQPTCAHARWALMHRFLSVCLSVWVCETYIVHHFVGTALRCAPPTCVVQNGVVGLSVCLS